MKKLTAFIICLALLFSLAACNTEKPDTSTLKGELAAASDVNFGFKQTTATDDYGRSFSAVTDYNENVVGIFYFLWLSQAAVDTNISSYEANGQAEETLRTNGSVSGSPTFTWWGEPMYGYYRVEDKWVVRKHVELFINAGLDFICFDTTNNDYYSKAARTVLDVLKEYKQAGYNVPRAMFMTNTASSDMAASIYRAFYRDNEYDDIWFYGNGDKPWILATYTGSDTAIQNRFYFKKAQWPNSTYNADNFPWMSWKYPQETFTDSQDYKIMNVSVSQHSGLNSGVNFSLSGLCAPYNYGTLSSSLKEKVSETQATAYYNANWGRGYSQLTKTNNPDDVGKNVNFEEQWGSVYKDTSVNLVFITGWNEWIAQRQSGEPKLGSSYGHFVDTFNQEFSRDVEMMNGGYLDNCYLQMVANVRRYKGSGYAYTLSHGKTASSVNLYDLASWKNMPVYGDITGETEARNSLGAGGKRYTNSTGRNDIKETRVAVTDSDVWFLITTAEDITERAATDTRWMNLFLGVNGGAGGWNGLNYVVNRSLSGTTASVDAVSGTAFAATSASAKTLVVGKHMLVKIPKTALGIEGNEFSLNFKVCDNLQKDFDVTELYTNGDCAPIGRICYTYNAKV